jgi:hypothetical protein
MVDYDFMELSDLLVRLSKSKSKNHDSMVYHLLSNYKCDWEAIIDWHEEHKILGDLQNSVPTLFADYDDVPLMINRVTDSEDEVILRWRLDLGK